jgi:Mg2+ and Co2+ transporter CorA
MRLTFIHDTDRGCTKHFHEYSSDGEFKSRLLTGQASRPYSMRGKHFVLTKLIITFSVAILPILPKIALNAR